MSIAEIIKSVEFLVDAAGNKKAAVVDWPVWEELLTLLEALEEEAALSEDQFQAGFPDHSQTFSLDSLLAQVTDQNLHEEIPTGPAVGREVW